jgi:hypothetical protein
VAACNVKPHSETPLRILVLAYLARMAQRLDAAIPRDDGVRERTLILLSSSAEMTDPWSPPAVGETQRLPH